MFLGLLRTHKGTDVALDLGLTQSAVSHALKRLRDVFGDDLFLRRPHGMEPTAVALALEPQVRTAVDALRGALAGAQPFDPAQATGELRLSAWDSVQTLIAPGLVRRLAEQSPGLRLGIRMLGRAAALDALVAGETDLALGYFPRLPDTLLDEALYSGDYAVVGLPSVLAEPMTLRRYLSLAHVLVSPGGDFTGIVDVTLAARRLTRRVVAAIPQFFPAMATVAETGAIATLPEGLARRFAPALGLALAEMPLPLRRFTISALRHRRNARDPRLVWVMGLLRESATEIEAKMPCGPGPG